MTGTRALFDKKFLLRVLQYIIVVFLALAVGAMVWILAQFGKTNATVIDFYLSRGLEDAGALNPQAFFSGLMLMVASVFIAVLSQKAVNAKISKFGSFEALFTWAPTFAFLATTVFVLNLAVSFTDQVELSKLEKSTSSSGEVALTNIYNVVHIFVESLSTEVRVSNGNTAYQEIDNLFPWTIKTSLEEPVGHTHTIAGLAATICGQEFPGASFSNIADDNHLLGLEICLSDHLKKNSYEVQYLGGADLAFQQKGDFLTRHNFSALGKSDWEQLGETQMTSWGQGLHDSRLFERAKGQIRYLASEGRPFYLSMLTLDTHYPYYKDPDCPLEGLANNEAVSFGCTLRTLGSFIEWMAARGLLENSVLIVQGDHLPMKADRVSGAAGEIAFFAHLPKEPNQEFKAPKTIFDIQRKVLDVLK